MENSELLQHPQVRSYINTVLKGQPTGTYGRQRIAGDVLGKISALVSSKEAGDLARDEAVAAALSELGPASALNRQYRRECAPENSKTERYDGGSRRKDRKKLLRIIIPCTVVLAAVIVLGVILGSPKKPDLGVVFVYNTSAPPRRAITEADAADIISVINSAIPDIDGDGDVNINYKFLDGNGEAYTEDNDGLKGRPELEDNYFESLGVFAKDSYVLYLCCPSMYNTYNEAEYFDYSEALTGPMFDGTLFDGWYACVIDWASVGKGSQAQTDAAMAVITALNS